MKSDFYEVGRQRLKDEEVIFFYPHHAISLEDVNVEIKKIGLNLVGVDSLVDFFKLEKLNLFENTIRITGMNFLELILSTEIYAQVDAYDRINNTYTVPSISNKNGIPTLGTVKIGRLIPDHTPTLVMAIT